MVCASMSAEAGRRGIPAAKGSLCVDIPPALAPCAFQADTRDDRRPRNLESSKPESVTARPGVKSTYLAAQSLHASNASNIQANKVRPHAVRISTLSAIRLP